MCLFGKHSLGAFRGPTASEDEGRRFGGRKLTKWGSGVEAPRDLGTYWALLGPIDPYSAILTCLHLFLHVFAYGKPWSLHQLHLACKAPASGPSGGRGALPISFACPWVTESPTGPWGLPQAHSPGPWGPWSPQMSPNGAHGRMGSK